MLKLDHIVVKVRDLEAAIAEYEAQGFTVTPGGEHPMFGSVNALIPFEDDTYIELIAFPGDMHPDATRSAPGRRVAEWRQRPYGPIDWALIPDNINAEIARLRAAGQIWDDPVPGQRVRTDGQLVQWWFGTPDTFLLPFLCADVTHRDLRVPPGTARQHSNGATGILEIEIATEQIYQAEQQFRILLEKEFTVVSLNDNCIIYRDSWQLRLSEGYHQNGRIFDVLLRGWSGDAIPFLPEEESDW
jgi:catechol 2,3-dioxygenase-like lactoylglutathione lyase family enzyme